MVADQHRVATPHDPTPSPDLRSEIESYYGVQIEQADPAQLKHVVDSSKSAGNKAFKEKRYRGKSHQPVPSTPRHSLC